MAKRKIRPLLGALLSQDIPTRYGSLLVLPTTDKASTYLAGKQGRGPLNVQMTTANKTLFNILALLNRCQHGGQNISYHKTRDDRN